MTATPDRPDRPDLQTLLRGFAPPARPPVLEGDVSYLVEATELGPMLLAVADDRLVTSAFAPDDSAVELLLQRLARVISPRVLRGGHRLDLPRRQLAEYLAGRRREFELPVNPVLATRFQREVLAALRSVGYGQRVSYGELATAIHRPRAARAVGSALGANPLCVVLPCHRVVAASGALTGYAGGLEAKRRLLELEAAAG